MVAQLAPFRRISIAASFHRASCLCSWPVLHNSTCLLAPSPLPSKMHPYLSPKLMMGTIFDFDKQREQI